MKKLISGLMLLGGFQVAMAQKPQVQLFQLDQVKLSPSPFFEAQYVDMTYMKAMDVDRLLAPYMLEAGLDWSAKRYPNWENTGLDGHIGGHYLSALAMMYASTGDEEMKRRMDYMVEQLAIAQKENGNGYVGGIPGGQAMWKEIGQGKIDAGGFSLNQKWVPLYNIHKIYAGLRDAYWIGKNEQAKTVLADLTEWFYELTKELTNEQFQQMLISEHGGMNEVFADVAAITGEEKYLGLAKKMSHKMVLEPLAQHEDELTGMHANTQIPKVIGFQRIAQEGNLAEWQDAADFFWHTVVEERSVTIGGNSVREHFHPVNDFSSMVSSNQGPETCNTYNMLRLSEQLFRSNPKAEYVDFFERGLYNHILSSQHPEKGGFVYFTPMRPEHYRVYSQPHQGFWCCVGSGLENHAKYGEFIYAHSKEELYINLFIPSELRWEEKGMVLKQKNNFPEEPRSSFTFDLERPQKMAVKLRYPSWVEKGALEVFVNGRSIKVNAAPSSFVTIDRKWRNGDQLEVKLPMNMQWEVLPDGSDWGAFVYGPIVLAATEGTENMPGLFADDSRMGHVAAGKMIPLAETPVLVSKGTRPEALPVPSSNPMQFELASIDADENVFTLRPFYQVHDTRYQIYWPISEPDKVTATRKAIGEKDEVMLALERATVDQVATGEQQPESDHFFKGEHTLSGNTEGYFWRSTTDWFSYELKNDNREGKKLRLVFPAKVVGNTFDIFINGKLFQEVQLENKEGSSQEIDYPLPESLQKEEKLVLEFRAENGQSTERIYYVRLMK
ncbi:glycoside hydrolase family 127 protein [Echinicola soli]|uniref:glycoside hydrolase family 127 protein n=1 Tax=Echinicola soli TaxID=2591634 RepID=UPI001AEF83D0|nr:glycoside hydrolase family 127 protein [Echinicola soli]